jgi:hypothetical protein
MRNILKYIFTGFSLAVVGLSGYAAYGYYSKKDESDKPIPNEPFAAGSLDLQRDDVGINEGGGTYNGVSTPTSAVRLDTGVGDAKTLVIPLDRTSEFSERIDPSVKEVKLTSPLIYIRDDGSAVLDAVQELTVNRSTPDGIKQELVYVDKEGNQYKSEQELFDAFIRQSSQQAILDLQQKKNLSTLESIQRGVPINVTNVITSRPEGFPEAKPDAISREFQERARALQPTLTVFNPGGSSAAGLPNFSRLAAVGTDLSQVDLYNVRNPNYIGHIKGQPLTPDQQVKLDQLRLKIDPRNMTSSDFAEQQAAKLANALSQAQREKRAAELSKAGYTEQQAKNYLASQGIKVTGSLTAQQFAAIEARLGPGATQACLNCTASNKTIDTSQQTTIGKSAQEKINIFLKQTGRKDLKNLTPAEQFAFQRLLQA